MLVKAKAIVEAMLKVNKLFGLSVGLMVFIMALMVTYDVLARYLVDAPSVWVPQTATYMMGYITFVGAAYGLQTGAHVKVEIFTSRSGPGVRRALEIVSWLINLVFFIVLSWEAFWFWWQAFQSGERSWGLLSVPLAIPYFFFFAGMVWLLIVQIALIFRPVRPAEE